MKLKKSQAAMEFLMTYGWALIVILLVIMSLGYFGILNPSRWLPDKCDMGAVVLQCRQVVVNSTHTTLYFTNNIGEIVYNVNVTLIDASNVYSRNTPAGSKIQFNINTTYQTRFKNSLLTKTAIGKVTTTTPVSITGSVVANINPSYGTNGGSTWVSGFFPTINPNEVGKLSLMHENCQKYGIVAGQCATS